MQLDIVEALRIVVDEINQVIPDSLEIVNNKIYLSKNGTLISNGTNLSSNDITDITKKINTNTTNIEVNQNNIKANTNNIKTIKSYFPLNGKNILMLGDSIMGADRTNGVPDFVKSFTGANVWNGGLSGTHLAYRGEGLTNNVGCLDGERIIDALISGNWSEQKACVKALYDQGKFKYFTETINTLAAIDMSTVDVLTLAFGTNDWTGGRKQTDVLNALTSVIDKVQKNFPHVRILVITPIYRYFGGSGSAGDSDTVTKIGSTDIGYTLKSLALKIEETAKNKRISVLNAYQELPLSVNNASTYFDKDSSTTDGLDHTHLNTNGNRMYAHIISGKLNSIF